MTDNDRAPVVFGSKRDAWLSVTIWLSVVGCLVAATAIVAQPGLMILNVVLAVALVAAAALMLWVLYGTSYTISRRAPSNPKWTLSANNTSV